MIAMRRPIGALTGVGLALLVLGVTLASKGVFAQAKDQRRPGSAPNPLVQALRSAFVARNSRVTSATVLELRSVNMGGGPYVLLGWGTPSDGGGFRGNVEDELFGVFIVDAQLVRIERTLDIFPTGRWGDYRVAIERLTDREVAVVGQGSYGDGKVRRVYSLGLPK